MAKESMKAREVKRAKLVAKYAEKRAALKKIINDPNTDPVDAFEAAQKLQAIPRNANPIRLHNRCKITGRPRATFVCSASAVFSSARWLLQV
jgi:small subunit ribosomal protein S14